MQWKTKQNKIRHETIQYHAMQCNATLLHSTLLYSTLLYSALLCSALLCSTLFYYTALYNICCTIPYYTILCTTWYYSENSILQYTKVSTLQSTILYYTILYYTILYYTILYYTILYYTILYYTILYYTILYYPTNPRNVLCWFWLVLKDLQSLQSVFLTAEADEKRKRLRFFAGPAALTYFYHVLCISIAMVLENLSIQLLVSGYLSE